MTELTYIDLVQLSCIQKNCCGITSTGSVLCWEVGPDPDFISPIHGAFLQLSTGIDFSCGIRISGEIDCWGRKGRQVKLKAGISRDNMQISCCKGYCCTLRMTGHAYCFGQTKATPPVVPLRQISCAKGGSHTVGLTTSNEFMCWGDNAFGQCNTPYKTQKFTKIVAGERFTCGLTRFDKILCWGKAPRVKNHNVLQIAAGERQLCALKSTGSHLHESLFCVS